MRRIVFLVLVQQLVWILQGWICLFTSTTTTWVTGFESLPLPITSTTTTRRRSRSRLVIICPLNRFLFDPSELEIDNAVVRVKLPKEDYRTLHAAKILGVCNGDTIRAGIVTNSPIFGLATTNATPTTASSPFLNGGYLTDHAIIEWIPEGNVKYATGPLKNGNPPGSLRIHLQGLHQPTTTSTNKNVSLLLALPRPLALGRLLPMISQMGIDELILTAAKKVPKDYFGSHLLRNPQLIQEKLMEGLCQSNEDVTIPTIRIMKRLDQFLEMGGDCEQRFPSQDYAKVIAHPMKKKKKRKYNNNDQQQQNHNPPSTITLPTEQSSFANDDDQDDDLMTPLQPRMRSIQFPNHTSRKILVAVGPEGGWDESQEIPLLIHHGFQLITLGSRILRTDCAVISLLALAHDTLAAAEPPPLDDDDDDDEIHTKQ